MSYRLLTSSDTSSFNFDETGCTNKILNVYAGNLNDRTHEFIDNVDKSVITYLLNNIADWCHVTLNKKDNTAYQIMLNIEPLNDDTINSRSTRIYASNNSSLHSNLYISINLSFIISINVNNNVGSNVEQVFICSVGKLKSGDTMPTNLNTSIQTILNTKTKILFTQSGNNFSFSYFYHQTLTLNPQIINYISSSNTSSVGSTYIDLSRDLYTSYYLCYKLLNELTYYIGNSIVTTDDVTIYTKWKSYLQDNHTIDLVKDTYTPVLLIDDAE